MTQVRLLPTVLIATVGLLFIKVVHLVANSDMIVGSSSPALAQEAPAQDAQLPDQVVGAQDAGVTTSGQNASMDTAAEPPAFVDGMRVDPTKSSRSELALLERLAQRRNELEERAKSLVMREALLKAAEKRLQQRVDELRELEASISLATKQRDKEKEEDLGKLVAMYQSMKPKQAAKIFEVLDQSVLLDIVRIMNSRKLAAILGQMKAGSAGALSSAIASGSTLEQDVESMQVNALPQIGN